MDGDGERFQVFALKHASGRVILWCSHCGPMGVSEDKVTSTTVTRQHLAHHTKTTEKA